MTKSEITLEEIAEHMRSALRYIRNEMNYRIYQIEGGHDIPLTGEMHTAVNRANEALIEYDEHVASLNKGEE